MEGYWFGPLQSPSKLTAGLLVMDLRLLLDRVGGQGELCAEPEVKGNLHLTSICLSRPLRTWEREASYFRAISQSSTDLLVETESQK